MGISYYAVLYWMEHNRFVICVVAMHQWNLCHIKATNFASFALATTTQLQHLYRHDSQTKMIESMSKKRRRSSLGGEIQAKLAVLCATINVWPGHLLHPSGKIIVCVCVSVHDIISGRTKTQYEGALFKLAKGHITFKNKQTHAQSIHTLKRSFETAIIKIAWEL